MNRKAPYTASTAMAPSSVASTTTNPKSATRPATRPTSATSPSSSATIPIMVALAEPSRS